jgi:hypothetical protein
MDVFDSTTIGNHILVRLVEAPVFAQSVLQEVLARTTRDTISGSL